MATEITISKINWANEPSGNQSVTLEYKLWSASTWTLIDNGVTVDPDGNILSSPLPSVSGLTEGSLYYLRVYNECASPVDFFTENFTP